MDADVDALPEAKQAQLGRYLSRYGDDGASLTGRLDDAELETFFDQSATTRRTLTRADGGDNGFDAKQFLRNTAIESRAVLDRFDGPTQTRALLCYGEGDLDANDLRRIDDTFDTGDMDQRDVQRMLGMLETKGANPYVDDDVDAADLLRVVDSSGDLSETRWVVKKQGEVPGLDNDVTWVEQGVLGDEGAGWQHIDDKHTSDIVNKYDSVEDSSDVERVLNDAIRDPDNVMTTADGKAVFVYRVEPGKKPVTVYVGSNGFIQTMYPQALSI